MTANPMGTTPCDMTSSTEKTHTPCSLGASLWISTENGVFTKPLKRPSMIRTKTLEMQFSAHDILKNARNNFPLRTGEDHEKNEVKDYSGEWFLTRKYPESLYRRIARKLHRIPDIYLQIMAPSWEMHNIHSEGVVDRTFPTGNSHS